MSSDLQPLVASGLAALTGALEALPAEAWRQPSVCEGWTVAHVVAHVTMAARYPAERFGAELSADGCDFQRMSDRLAEQDSVLPPADLLAGLRSEGSGPPTSGGHTGTGRPARPRRAS